MDQLSEAQKKAVEDLTKRLNAQGKLIEAGFGAMRIICIPHDAPDVQVREMRKAFMLGAQHLFGSVMSLLSTDTDPTPEDMRNMTLIYEELEAFKMELTSEHSPGHS